MAMRKVTDPAKKTTDPVLLAHLAKMGIDPEFVEFTDDYGAYVYKDSSDGIGVITILSGIEA